MFQVIERVEWLMLKLGSISGFATLLIMILVCIDVVGRWLFNLPLRAGVEMSELLLVSLVFLGLAAAQQRRQNYAIDILYAQLSPRIQRILDYFSLICCVGILVVLAWPSSTLALASFYRNEMGFGLAQFPIWPARILLAIGLWFLALQFAFDLLRLIFDRPRAQLSQSTLEGLLE